ncbi:hypothetical protein [uncultured Pseudoramibacter sp.]|uniref:hypothetical protein n=1 Tax=uncultured Pseudoramibacter sp. TaxID=1623493 RepID=UPI0025E22A7F|nr:hypothetical protein [uncultured Pseudoramibacter sp.]
MRERRHMHFEQLPANRQDLTFNVLQMAAVREIGIAEINQDILKTLNLYSNTQGYNHAAELLADVNGFPGIDIARFGESISIILKREIIENRSILTELDETVKIFRDFYRYEAIQGMERKVVERIPEEAFRETIANALIHRILSAMYFIDCILLKFWERACSELKKRIAAVTKSPLLKFSKIRSR